MNHSVGIDVGGTFTDLVAVSLDDGAVVAGKVLSTPHDQSQGVEEALRTQGPPSQGVTRIVHGTTVVTNMLLERRGARVVLCATEGATDLLEGVGRDFAVGADGGSGAGGEFPHPDH